MRGPAGLRPFAHRDFTLFWTGLSVSIVGDWMESTTTAWLLYQLTGSPLLLGLGGAIRACSTIAFGLIGGAVADRVPRRRLLLITQTSFAFSSLVLGSLIATGHVQFWHIYLFSAANGAIGSFDGPARRALFPSLVPRSDMQSAVMLNSAAIRTGRLIGPSLAGVIIAVYGPATSYFVNFASYAAIIFALVALRIREEPLGRSGRLARSIVEGLQYMFRKPLLRSILAIESTQSILGLNSALVTIVATDVLRVGPEGLGLLLSSQSAGALLATAALVASGDLRRKGRAMIAAGFGYCVALAALGLAPSLSVAALVILVCGACDALWATLRTTVVQLETDGAYRGRAMGVLLLTGRGFTQASQLESGLAVAVGGAPFALILGAGLIASALVAVNAATPQLRSFVGTTEEPATATAAVEATAAEP